jgi:hypothetical protein
VDLIDLMVEMIGMADDLQKTEFEALTNGLRDLKRQSISSACRALIEKYCGKPAAKRFTQAYKIRSKIIHGGEPPSGN